MLGPLAKGGFINIKLVTSQIWKLLLNVERLAEIAGILPLMLYILQ
jgi:hypothetical protein